MLEIILATIAILGALATLHGNYRLIRDVGRYGISVRVGIKCGSAGSRSGSGPCV